MTQLATQILQRQNALSRRDNEGGACANEAHPETTDLTNSELVLLRIRVIALESLMVALLAEGSERQLEVARGMATYISPRAGFKQHSLTIQAAHHMTEMVHRAIRFRAVRLS